jgi:solute carrier family 4 (anion exchanger), member 2
MIGVVDFLDRPVMAFVRLTNAQLIVEMPVKVKFLFILLGPPNDNIDYLEIGRCMGTLMTNKHFHESAYRANDRRELINDITQFTNRSLCVVLPAGNFDHEFLSPVIEWIQNKMKNKLGKSNSDQNIYEKNKIKARRSSSSQSKHLSVNKVNDLKHQISQNKTDDLGENEKNDGVAAGNNDPGDDYGYEEDEFNPFQRTGRLFGCLIKEVKYRYSKYASDFTDAFNWHCMISLIFLFTVNIAPTLSFGGILADKTNHWFGVNEMLIGTSVNGIIFSLFSGQPLMIMGPTGPFLVFEEMLFNFCKEYFCIEYLATRCWVIKVIKTEKKNCFFIQFFCC